THRKAKFIKRDFFKLYKEWEGKFGTVWEWNCLCAFPPSKREGWLRSILHLLQPHGHLIGIFRIDSHEDEKEEPPYGISETNLEKILSPFFDLNFIKILDDDTHGNELSWRVYRCRI